MRLLLKEMREQKNISQAELAKKSGISQQLISVLETGTQKSTSTEKVAKLADALGVSFFDLLKLDE